jgi:predicted O-methyltransferase YrrM
MKINPKNRRTLVESLNIDGFNTAVEVGVRTGWFSKYILEHTTMKVYAVDPWEDNAELTQAQAVYEECTRRLAPYGERCEMVKGYSPAVASRFEDKSIDFVYIDGLHDYQSVLQDITAWWSKIRDGGILSGHDFNRVKWTGVVRSVEEFCEEKDLSFYLTGVVGNAFESHTGDLDEYDGDEHSWYIVKGKKKVG